MKKQSLLEKYRLPVAVIILILAVIGSVIWNKADRVREEARYESKTRSEEVEGVEEVRKLWEEWKLLPRPAISMDGCSKPPTPELPPLPKSPEEILAGDEAEMKDLLLPRALFLLGEHPTPEVRQVFTKPYMTPLVPAIDRNLTARGLFTVWVLDKPGRETLAEMGYPEVAKVGLLHVQEKALALMDSDDDILRWWAMVSHEVTHYFQFLNESDKPDSHFLDDPRQKHTELACATEFLYEWEAYRMQCSDAIRWCAPEAGPEDICWRSQDDLALSQKIALWLVEGDNYEHIECHPIWARLAKHPKWEKFKSP